MSETASLKRPVDETEDTKETINGAESTVRSSCLTVMRGYKICSHCEFGSFFLQLIFRCRKLTIIIYLPIIVQKISIHFALVPSLKLRTFYFRRQKKMVQMAQHQVKKKPRSRRQIIHLSFSFQRDPRREDYLWSKTQYAGSAWHYRLPILQMRI